MSDIDPFERLKLTESRTYNKRYFYFDPSDGTVISIHNSIVDDPYPFVEISIEELPENFTSMNLTDFLVVVQDDKHKITSKKIITEKIDRSIPTIYVSSKENINEKPDLLIEQDNSKKEFRLILSEEAKRNYARAETELNFRFFVTLENDPLILYMTLVVPFKNLLENNMFVIPFGSYDGIRSKLYTVKFFQKYLHVVYNENTNT